MKANEFVRKFGWIKAKYCLELCASPQDKWFVFDGNLICDDEFDKIKRLVESHDLIEQWGGPHGAKNTLKLLEESLSIGLYHGMDGIDAETEVPKLKQAIADVESCL